MRQAHERRPRHAELTLPLADTARQDPVEVALLRLVHLVPGPLPPLSSAQWQALLQRATWERVGPLAHRAVEALAAPAPEEVRAGLRVSYEQAATTVGAIYRQVADMQRVLRPTGIPALLFKGAALARFTYREEALRPFSDIDVLILRKDVAAVHRALRAAGYDIIGGAPTEADLTWRHGRAYYDPQGIRVPIDVHWRFLGYPLQVTLDHEGIFQRAAEVTVAGEAARILSPTDLVVASGAAFLRELWYGKPRLRYLRDAAEVAERSAVDWSQVLRTAQQAPLLRTPLYIALAAAQRLLGAPVPEALLAALRRGRGLSGFLVARAGHTLLRREHPAAAVLQMGAMRWLDGGPVGLARWVRDLLLIPAPLAAGRRRWLRHLWEG
jgi:hypothetical protein